MIHEVVVGDYIRAGEYEFRVIKVTFEEWEDIKLNVHGARLQFEVEEIVIEDTAQVFDG